MNIFLLWRNKASVLQSFFATVNEFYELKSFQRSLYNCLDLSLKVSE